VSFAASAAGEGAAVCAGNVLAAQKAEKTDTSHSECVRSIMHSFKLMEKVVWENGFIIFLSN
jgi:hypothetical protein